jgi:hypothetical protein
LKTIPADRGVPIFMSLIVIRRRQFQLMNSDIPEVPRNGDSIVQGKGWMDGMELNRKKARKGKARRRKCGD